MAQTSELSCGDTITADTTLEGDLTDCPSNGLVIGADDITLDLNGHTISGDGKPVRRCPRRQPCDWGVFNDRHDGVTVRNGSLRGFAVGVLVGGVRGNRLVELSSSRNQFIEKGRGNVVARNVIARTKHSGIRLGIDDPPIGSTRTVVRGNLVIAARQDGYWVAESDRRALLVGNIARRSGDDGFDIDSRSARLMGNRALGSAGQGFELQG